MSARSYGLTASEQRIPKKLKIVFIPISFLTCDCGEALAQGGRTAAPAPVQHPGPSPHEGPVTLSSARPSERSSQCHNQCAR